MIREIVLRHYFNGEAELTELCTALTTATEHRFHYQFMDMDTLYPVSRADLLMLCEAVAQGELEPTLLAPIGEWLVRSEQFELPEDEVMTEVCYRWMEAEVDFPLHAANVALCAQWLRDEVPLPD